MAYHGWDEVAYVLIDGVDIATVLTSLAFEHEATLTEKHFAGNEYPTAIATGTSRGAIEIGTVLNSPTTDDVAATSGTGKAISVLYSGNTVGELCAIFPSVKVGKVGVTATPDDIHSLAPEFTNSGEAYLLGRVVAALAARVADGDTESAPCDLGASNEIAAGKAVLHVTDCTLGGYDNVVVKLRDSDDDITYADHTTFTAVTAAGAESKTLATATERYLAISWAWTGAGSDQTFTGYVGIGAD